LRERVQKLIGFRKLNNIHTYVNGMTVHGACMNLKKSKKRPCNAPAQAVATG
jgi:hypothetical protein